MMIKKKKMRELLSQQLPIHPWSNTQMQKLMQVAMEKESISSPLSNKTIILLDYSYKKDAHLKKLNRYPFM